LARFVGLDVSAIGDPVPPGEREISRRSVLSLWVIHP